MSTKLAALTLATGGLCYDEDPIEDVPDEDGEDGEDGEVKEIKLGDIDLSTREAGIKSMKDLRDAVLALGSNDAAIKRLLDKAIGEVSKLGQRLAEAEALAKAGPAPIGPEAELADFVTEKGVRLDAEETQDGFEHGLLDTPKIHGDWHRDVREAVEDLSLLRIAIRARPTKAMRRVRNLFARCPHPELRRALDVHVKGFDSQTGSGLDWIPTPHLPMLEREIQVEAKLVQLLRVRPITSLDQKSPLLTTGLRPYLAGKVTTDDPAMFEPSQLGTDARTVTAFTLAVRAVIDDLASEDSATDALPQVRDEISTALSLGLDDILLNGDTATSSVDDFANWDLRGMWGTGKPLSIDHRTATIGLRARAIDDTNSVDRGTFTSATLLVDLATNDPPRSDSIIVTSWEGYFKNIASLAEVVTLEKFGPNASVLVGEIGKFAARPIVLSEIMGADMNASGLYDNTVKTKTGLVIFPLSRWALYVRRAMRLELQRDATRGINHLVATWRGVPKAVSAKKVSRYAYNMAKS